MLIPMASDRQFGPEVGVVGGCDKSNRYRFRLLRAEDPPALVCL
jgi:hypothetical protein